MEYFKLFGVKKSIDKETVADVITIANIGFNT